MPYGAIFITGCRNCPCGQQRLWLVQSSRGRMLQARSLAAGLVWCLSLGLGTAVAMLVGAVLWLQRQAAGEGAAGGGEQPEGATGDWQGLYRAKDHPSPALQRRDNLRLPTGAADGDSHRREGWKPVASSKHKKAPFPSAVPSLQSRYSALEKLYGKRERVDKWTAKKTRPQVRKGEAGTWH